ncbi:MAG: ATP-binding protein [Candidatus Dependentiae bacterium]
MYIKRDISNAILAGAKQVPVVAIVGPRQSGKSTLAKHIFKKHTYIDMQDNEIFTFANNDPKGFLETYKNEHGIIIDEAQYAPKLFAQIKVEADKNPQSGYYVLSGSQNFLSYEKISESLAGRVYFYTLLPFSIKELKSADLLLENVDHQIMKGFYPRVYQPQINAHEYYQNYMVTYIERDIRSIRNIDDILIFKKFIQLCAVRVGAPLNITDLAMHCGIGSATAKSWLALLETSFIIFRLPSYHSNLGKRVTKSPKLYFYDVGLAATLMGLNQDIIIKKRDVYGALFENMVIVDLIKNYNATNVHPVVSYFRDSNQKEVDLIVEHYGKITPVEIKASQTMDNRFFDTTIWFNEKIKSHQKPIVIYGGNQLQKRSKGFVVPWNNVNYLIDQDLLQDN